MASKKKTTVHSSPESLDPVVVADHLLKLSLHVLATQFSDEDSVLEGSVEEYLALNDNVSQMLQLKVALMEHGGEE